jgi:cytochrome P450
MKLVVSLVALLVAWSFFVKGRKRRLPPGPFPLPIIGNLHQLGKLPHQALAALSLKFGPLMSLNLGSALTLVVSSPDMAKEFFKTHDLVFASRPPSAASNSFWYNCTDIGFAPYGHYWREVRKLCVFQLLNSRRLEFFRFIREEEVSAMIQSIANSDHPVNISKTVSTLATDIMCRMTFGKKFSDQDSIGSRRINSMIKESFVLAGAFNFGDYIPSLAWMDLQGLNRRMKDVHSIQDYFLEKILDEHVAQNDPNVTRDLVDVLLAASVDKDMELQITRDNIKSLLYDMLSAGTDTSSTTLEWAMAELLRNPTMLKKVQDELERVVGMERMVRESDLPSLLYLQAVVKETLRLHPASPLALPHLSMEACNVLGYEIPKNTHVLVNLWAIGRNPAAWEDAERFVPERFMKGCSMEEKLRNCEWIPFGAGRRGCPGEELGMLVVQYGLAQLLHCFDWTLPDKMNGLELDMSEKYGITVRTANEIFAVRTPRPVVL